MKRKGFKIQGIKPKRDDLRCKIRIMNKSGDDCLTTFAPECEGSVQVATDDLRQFISDCIDEYGPRFKSHAIVAGRRYGESDFDHIRFKDIDSPDFSLEPFDEVLIHPVPIVGG